MGKSSRSNSDGGGMQQEVRGAAPPYGQAPPTGYAQGPAYPPMSYGQPQPPQGYGPAPGYPPQPGYGYGAPGYPQQQYQPGNYGQWQQPPQQQGRVSIDINDPPAADQANRGGGFKWGAQNWEVDEDKKMSEDMDKKIRMGFIRKVYAILTCQLLITFGLALWFNLDIRAANFLAANPWVLIVCTVFMCFTVCGMTCIPKLARTSPTNYIMLGVLSVCMGGILGYATGKVSSSAFAQAAGITAAVTLAVSLFACQTKWDFTGLGIYAFVALVILMMFGIIAGIVRSKVTQIVYASLGAALFSFYIIMDTQKIVGGKHRKYEFSIDDYAFAALALYLDIINLFMYILQILAMTENG